MVAVVFERKAIKVVLNNDIAFYCVDGDVSLIKNEGKLNDKVVIVTGLDEINLISYYFLTKHSKTKIKPVRWVCEGLKIAGCKALYTEECYKISKTKLYTILKNFNG